jgi:hypothetical protein
LSFTRFNIFKEVSVSPFREAAILLFASVSCVVIALWLTISHDNWLYLAAGLIAGLLLSYKPILVAVGIYLLWKNPEKYKERAMKQRRQMSGRLQQVPPTTEEALAEEE